MLRFVTDVGFFDQMDMDNIGNYIHNFKTGEKSWSDQQVINQVLSGQKEYFEILVRRHNQQLFRIARAYLPLDAEAEDAMQEAYIKAFQNLASFQGRAKFSTWLIRILINCALRRKRQLELSNSQIDIDLLVRSEDPQFENRIMEQSKEQQLINKNIQHTLEQAIDELPEKYRLVFIMRMVQNMSSLETADCLGLSNENVKIRLHRAKKLLRQRLDHALNLQDLYGFYLERCDRITAGVLNAI